LPIALGLGVLFLTGVWSAWFFTIDDAFITFRYSANLAAGHGPVWNPGENPVEGFTNFLWMLWHTPFAWLGLNLPLVAKLTSFAAGAAILVMLVRYCRTNHGLVAALVAGGAFVLYLPTYFHITSGLETVAFAALILRAVIVGLNAIEGRRVRVWELPLLLVLAGMLRPDGVLATLPAFLVWLWIARRDRRAWVFTAIAAVVGAGYFAWRWSYYGYPFPNTYYVKFGNITAGTEWFDTTVWLYAPLLVLTAALFVWRHARKAALVLCATVVTTSVTYVVSGPTMDYLHRFAFHTFPVLCLGTGLAAGAIARSAGKAWLTTTASALAGVFALGWVAVGGVQAPDLGVIANYGPDLARTHVAIGQGLAKADIPAEARTIALHDAGAMSYYSGWRTVDFIGLNDEAIAHGADPTTVVTGARPTVIVVRSYGPGPVATAYHTNIREAARGYVHITRVQMRKGYYLHIYAVPQYADQIRAAVLPVVDQAQRTYDPGNYSDTVHRWLTRLRNQL
jgi:hypothetical protein